jgi:diadenosine tetraphosphate (Ap4A) HIT family hydrolase
VTFNLNPQLEKDTLKVASTALSEILLMNDSRYPWLILVPRVDESISELFQLSKGQQAQVFEESMIISNVLNELFCPDKLNFAAIGNKVRQLHLHHVVRYETDFAWPDPVWGKGEPMPYEMSAQVDLLKRLQAEFKCFFDVS